MPHGRAWGKDVVSTNDSHVVISPKIVVVSDDNHVVNSSSQKIIVFDDTVSLFFRADMLSMA